MRISLTKNRRRIEFAHCRQDNLSPKCLAIPDAGKMRVTPVFVFCLIIMKEGDVLSIFVPELGRSKYKTL